VRIHARSISVIFMLTKRTLFILFLLVIPFGVYSVSDTNWQTSWTTLDANLKTTYPLKTDINSWGDARYAPIGSSPLIKIKTADQSTANTLVSVTELDTILLANKKYGFHCRIIANADSSTTGIWVAMLTPAAPTYFSAKIIGWTSTTAIATTNVTASDTVQANLNSNGTTNATYEIMGSINNVTAGTLTPRFQSETATAITAKAGSWCLYTQGV